MVRRTTKRSKYNQDQIQGGKRIKKKGHKESIRNKQLKDSNKENNQGSKTAEEWE